MVKCPHCQREKRQNKAGRTRFGSQRSFCLECRRTYTPAPQAQGHPRDVRQEALRYSLEGLSQRKVGRLLQVAPNSVANWLLQAGATLEEQQVPLVPPALAQQADKVMEQDEIYTFLSAKKTKKGATRSTRRGGST
jgi:transposase-like protein